MVPKVRSLTTTSSDPIEALETQMMILVRNFTLLGRRHEGAWGMDRAGYLLLRTLEQIGPASINTLADTLGLDGSTVTRQVASMQESGLVQRETDPNDRRCSIIRPTPEGVEQMTDFRERRRDSVKRLTNGWSASERRTLSKMLARLNESISALADGHQPAQRSRKRRSSSRRFRHA